MRKPGAVFVTALVLALFASAGQAVSSASAPEYIFLIKRRVAYTRGNGVLIKQNPRCVLTAAHTVGFEDELVDLDSADGARFSGKVIKLSAIGSRLRPGDKMGLALVEILPTGIPLPRPIEVSPAYTYKPGELFDVWAIFETRSGGPRYEWKTAYLQLFTLDIYEVEAQDASIPPSYIDLIEVMAAVETGTQKVQSGFSGAAVRSESGKLAGIIQANRMFIPSPYWRNVEVETVAFTPHALIRKFISGTKCDVP